MWSRKSDDSELNSPLRVRSRTFQALHPLLHRNSGLLNLPSRHRRHPQLHLHQPLRLRLRPRLHPLQHLRRGRTQMERMDLSMARKEEAHPLPRLLPLTTLLRHPLHLRPLRQLQCTLYLLLCPVQRGFRHPALRLQLLSPLHRRFLHTCNQCILSLRPAPPIHPLLPYLGHLPLLPLLLPVLSSDLPLRAHNYHRRSRCLSSHHRPFPRHLP